MSNQNKDHSRFIHISNIAAEATEHELRELFSTIGQIASFVFDPQANSKHARSARLEFHNAETAAIAIQHLSGHSFKRKSLVVTELDKFASKQNQGQVIGSHAQRNTTTRLPQGAKAVINDTRIYDIVGSMTEKEQAEILVEFKNLATNHPEQMRQLLIDSPQFAHTILTLMTIFQLVDKDVVESFNVHRRQSALSNAASATAAPEANLSPDEQKFYELWGTMEETKRQQLRDQVIIPLEKMTPRLQNITLIFKSIESKLSIKL